MALLSLTQELFLAFCFLAVLIAILIVAMIVTVENSMPREPREPDDFGGEE